MATCHIGTSMCTLNLSWNTTHFVLIRRALRTLFADESDRRPRDRFPGKIWWTDEWSDDWDDSGWHSAEWSPTSAYGSEHDAFWADWEWTNDDWSDDWNWDEQGIDWNEELVEPDEQANGPEEASLREAYNIATEASRTLKEAREAVRKVRQARGYYSPEASTGKGLTKNGGNSSKGSKGKSKSKGKQTFGPCFICGKSDHGYRQCPDRHSAYGGKGKPSKGKFFKGKGKGQSKGVFHFHSDYSNDEIQMDIFSSQWDQHALNERKPTWAFLDTGATENAIGEDSLQDMIDAGNFKYHVDVMDRPVFRFGNGQKDQASSKVTLQQTALGDIPFYVLGGEGRRTPPLVGARTLRDRKTLLSYGDGTFLYSGDQDMSFTIPLHAMKSRHVAVDLCDEPAKLDLSSPPLSESYVTRNLGEPLLEEEGHVEQSINVMWCDENFTDNPLQPEQPHVDVVLETFGMDEKLQILAQRLDNLRSSQRFRDSDGSDVGSFSMRRPEEDRVSVRGSPQSGSSEGQPVCFLGKLLKMRSSIGLSVQEGLRWRRSSDGARASFGEDCPGQSPGGHSTTDVLREGRGGEDHGGQGQDASDGPDTTHGYQPDILPVQGSLGEAGFYGECASPGTFEKHDGTAGDEHVGHGRGCGEEHVEIREAGVDGRELRSTSAIEEGRGESREVERHGADSEGQVPCEDEDPEEGDDEGHHQEVDGDVIESVGSGGRVEDRERGRGGSVRASEGTAGRLRVLQGALQRLRMKMGGASSTKAELEEVSNASRQDATRHSDGTTLAYEEPCTTNDNTLRQPISKSTTCTSTTSKTLMNTHGIPLESSIDSLAPEAGQGVTSIREEQRNQSSKNILPQSTSRRIASGMAAIGAMVMFPVQGLMAQMSMNPDFVEVACSPTSSLSEEMMRLGFMAKRVNYKEGYDLESPKGTSMLRQELLLHPPRCTWISLPCTRLSPLVNLTERTPEEWARFEQRQMKDLKRAEEVSNAVGDSIEKRIESDFAWEWPTGASKGWKSKAIRRLVYRMHQLGKKIYWCRFHGCAYGLEFRGLPVQKSWTVLTTNRHIWLALQKKCPGHPEHVHCRGEAAKASSYYPQKMVKAITRGLVGTWTSHEKCCGVSLAEDVERYLLEVPQEEEEGKETEECFKKAREEDPQVLALTKDRFTSEPPKGKKLEQVKQQMMRIHRASGHSSFSNLQRLLRMRKAPEWAIEMAGQLECPECLESRRPMPAPVASLHELPQLWEVVGTDVFEYEHDDKKHKFILWRDRASGYAFVEHLQSYDGAWEPSTSHVVGSLVHWLMINPCPTWIISDAGTIYTSEEFMEFAGRSGIGLLTAPAEAHHIMGPEEGCIGILKNTVRRLLKEEQSLSADQAFALAVHGHNNTINSTGFSPFQWVRGGSCPQENLLPGPRKAFGGVLRLKEKARVAYEQEHAKQRLSRLNNSVVRRPMACKTGDLVMIWRQRGKGQWVGPVRVLLQEGGTMWLASGASLIKARINQVRKCSKRKELDASVSGASVFRNPVTLETLLRDFTGKHYTRTSLEKHHRQSR